MGEIMEYKCPYCGKQNNVAGWRGFVYQQDGQERTATLVCWSCHRVITQKDLTPKQEEQK